MIIQIDCSFEKDVKRLPSDVQQKLKQLIQQIQKFDTFQRLVAKNYLVLKMPIAFNWGITGSGYKDGETIVLSRVLNRKEIYRFFPKK